MKASALVVDDLTIPCYSVNTLIVGSGAASLNAALRLFEAGQKDIAIATEGWGAGTSNNAGSDKQTYYKQSLSGQEADSPIQMAQDLFSGGSMHGDIALCEAQNSVRAFFDLVSLGIPFPHDRFGGYVGYKTDHDPLGRGTSAGPLTSHLMFAAMAAEVKKKNIRIFDNHEIIALLTEDRGTNRHVIGAVALDTDELSSERRGLVVFNAVNVVLGTGGPGGLYRQSVYPESQLGSHGLALSIGAIGQNLTESQFGLASIKFRWNLSGTYQQVIPRYFSTDADGRDEMEFLNGYFPDMGRLATAVFLKGYQWPFDPRKVRDYGSSLIDVLVYQETVVKGRRVFLDYTANPSGGDRLKDFAFDDLGQEAYSYLDKSKALFGIPIERLMAMNPSAVDLYKNNGIDIEKEPLEIAVCAQHNNGGLKGNIWWESNIKHLFPVGEVNGSHGVYRPGGSALNAGQVGSLRAALFIAKKYASPAPEKETFAASVSDQIKTIWEFIKKTVDAEAEKNVHLCTIRKDIQDRMSCFGAHIRDPKQIEEARKKAWALYERLQKEEQVYLPQELPEVFKNLDLCLTHAVYLEAIEEYLRRGGKSRGSFLVLDTGGDFKPNKELGEDWRFSLNEEGSFVEEKILELQLDREIKVIKNWVDIRPIPQEASWFETVWKDYLEDNLFKT